MLTALEIRLAEPSPTPVDLSVRLTTPDQARAVGPRLPPSPLTELLEDWAADAPALAPVHSLWLEFDLHDDPGDALPDPVVCARIRQGPYRRDVGWLTDELFPRLHGRALTDAQRHLVRRAVEAIPDGCRLLYAFSLRPRPDGGVRLEIYGEDAEALLGYLETVAPPLRRAAEPGERLLAGTDRLHVSFDLLDDGLGRRVGVEGSFRKLPGTAPHREPRWLELAERLGGPTLADDLVTWTGVERLESAKILRAVSHCKVAHDPGSSGSGASPQVKLYLTALRSRTT